MFHAEVGGDHYDFFQGKESLYVAVGDATGHGMTAGMMVSITKAGLYGTPQNIPPNEVSYILNRTIKAIDLGTNTASGIIHKFEFLSAPNLHWPDTIFSFDHGTGILYTCDAFGLHYCSDELFDID